ncbi:hypothetical protein GUJ93_ZPchr0007g5746 [Zizania palustris]|uniref:Uncharacterized protein n=1 Tax=Zizania palustris TaxID=103762 RepID=A0A8J5T446_ZIZPA|nr:hypothetical protein GUJ93_ZPchr0007g5746 [Zizania palustris]
MGAERPCGVPWGARVRGRDAHGRTLRCGWVGVRRSALGCGVHICTVRCDWVQRGVFRHKYCLEKTVNKGEFITLL